MSLDLELRKQVYHQQPVDKRNKILAQIRDNKQTRYIIQNNIRTIAYDKALRNSTNGIYPDIINTLIKRQQKKKHKYKHIKRKKYNKKFKGGKINFYNTKTNKFSGGNIMSDIKIVHSSGKNIY